MPSPPRSFARPRRFGTPTGLSEQARRRARALRLRAARDCVGAHTMQHILSRALVLAAGAWSLQLRQFPRRQPQKKTGECRYLTSQLPYPARGYFTVCRDGRCFVFVLVVSPRPSPPPARAFEPPPHGGRVPPDPHTACPRLPCPRKSAQLAEPVCKSAQLAEPVCFVCPPPQNCAAWSRCRHQKAMQLIGTG